MKHHYTLWALERSEPLYIRGRNLESGKGEKKTFEIARRPQLCPSLFLLGSMKEIWEKELSHLPFSSILILIFRKKVTEYSEGVNCATPLRDCLQMSRSQKIPTRFLLVSQRHTTKTMHLLRLMLFESFAVCRLQVAGRLASCRSFAGWSN